MVGHLCPAHITVVMEKYCGLFISSVNIDNAGDNLNLDGNQIIKISCISH